MTSIEWTDRTWNPVTGCTKVSAGCKNCYAEGVANRFWAKNCPPVAGRSRRFTDVQCHPDRLDEPLRWRKPCRVFVNSMSDLFHDDVPDEFIDHVFAVMALAPQHTFQVLTKRPERMRLYMENELPMRWLRTDSWNRAAQKIDPARCFDASREVFVNPLPNVWLGVSVEDQRAADERIPLLFQTPAAVRFLSCEPLIGPVAVGRWLHESHCDASNDASPCLCVPKGNRFAEDRIDWVIVGGESGPGARPCDVAWVRSIVEQCRAAGVPAFVEQLGAVPIVRHPTDAREVEFTPRGGFLPPWVPEWAAAWITRFDRKGGDPSEWPDDLRVREFPASAVGGAR